MDESAKSRTVLHSLRSVSLLTVVSRITGLTRDAVMASLFGTGWIFDAFTVAFRIPNLFRRLFGEGALTAALLPSFVRTDQQLGRAAASELIAKVSYRLLAILSGIVLTLEAGLLLLRTTVQLDQQNQMLCDLTMLMLPYALLICLAAVFCAALNAVDHFVVPALVPVALNVVWLAAGVTAATLLNNDLDRVRLIAISVVVGGCLQLLLARWQARQHDIRASNHVSGDVKRKTGEQVSTVFRTMLPVMLGLSIGQINGLLDSGLAWFLVPTDGNSTTVPAVFQLPEGTASALYLGQRMFHFPLGVFGVALSTVLFPRFARHANSMDFDELKTDLLHGLQLVIAISVPASVGLALISTPLTDALFRYGQFDKADALLTARMIIGHGVTVWTFCGLLIVNRVFYATGQHVTPMKLGLISVASNVVLNIALLPVCSGLALPLASGLATLIQLCLSIYVLSKRNIDVTSRDLLTVAWRCCVATFAMSMVTMLMTACATVSADVAGRAFQKVANLMIPLTAAVATYWLSLLLTGISPTRLLRIPFSRATP